MASEDFTEIFDWDNFFSKSKIFKNNKPFKFAFFENILESDFYKKCGYRKTAID